MPIVKRPSGMRRTQAQRLILFLETDNKFKDRDVLRTRDCANLFGIHTVTWRGWLKKDKKLRSLVQVINGKSLILKKDLIEWIKSKAQWDKL